MASVFSMETMALSVLRGPLTVYRVSHGCECLKRLEILPNHFLFLFRPYLWWQGFSRLETSPKNFLALSDSVLSLRLEKA